MEETIAEVINTTLHSFDFTFCAIVNIASYIFIKAYIETYGVNSLKTWYKRIIFVVISIILGMFYIYFDSDAKVILNSIIVAPVSWSWLFKPICDKLNIDYHKKKH